MTAEPSAAESVVRSPITLLRELQSGSLSATALSKEARLACVEHLTLEGYSVGEIAEVLRASTRTIHGVVAWITKRAERRCLRVIQLPIA